MLLAPWVLVLPTTDALEILYVLTTMLLGLSLLYLLGRYIQD